MIERLRVVNFRSFGEIDIELRPVNVVVGANASGKSNFVQIFRFLRDLARHGLENAVSLQSGVGKISNLKTGSDITEITVEYVLKLYIRRGRHIFVTAPAHLGFTIQSAHHRIAIGYNRRSQTPRIEEEEIEICFRREDGDELKWGRVSRKRDKVEVTSEIEEFSDFVRIALALPLGRKGKGQIPDTISIAQVRPYLFPVYEYIPIYDFQPKLAKQAVPITGSAELEEDGRNLALVLQRILRNAETRKHLLMLVRDFLPFLQSLGIQTLPTSSVMLQAQESYLGKRFLPASLLSDGSVEIIALLIALYFNSPFIQTMIFEEPERNLHPALMAKLMETFRDVSSRYQIILTTHNPELVECAKVEELLLIERDRDGFSVIKRPAEQKMVQEFLKEQLGLGTLHKNQLLGAQ